MSSSLRKVLHQIYTESQDFTKRRFDISAYKDCFEQVSAQALWVMVFREFPGNFARKLSLRVLPWLPPFHRDDLIQVLEQLKEDELALVYFVSFVKRYFDLDLTPLCPEKNLYLRPITYFMHSSTWVLELERMKVDIEYLKSLKEKLHLTQSE